MNGVITMQDGALNKALKLVREAHNMKAKDLAARLDISNSFLSEIETGKKNPTIDLLKAYGEVFNLRPSFFLLFSEELSGHGTVTKMQKKAQNTMLKLLDNAATSEIKNACS